MAVKKSAKDSPTIIRLTGNPNTNTVYPGKPGDIAIDTTNKIFYIACGSGNTDWGTGGTVGA